MPEKGRSPKWVVLVVLIAILIAAALLVQPQPGPVPPTPPEPLEVSGELFTKVADEPGWETHFTSTSITPDSLVIRFYHDAPEPQPVWVEGGINYTLSTGLAGTNQPVELAVPLVDDQVPQFKLHVGPDSEVFAFGGPLRAPGCGDDILDVGEDCDDGNTANGDGCNSTCGFEFPSCGDVPGLVSYWKFDQAGGRGVPDHVGSNDGEIEGDAHWITGGINNSAIYVDGNDHTVIPDNDSLDVRENFTILVWGNLSVKSAYKTLLNKGGTWGPYQLGYRGYSYDRFQFFGGGGNCDSWAYNTLGTTITANKWYFWAAVMNYSGYGARLYRNAGVLHAADASVGLPCNSSGTLNIGSRGAWEWWVGEIDEVAIFNRTLPLGEIRTYFYKTNASYSYCESELPAVQVTETLTPNATRASRPVYVSGHMSLTNGTDIANNNYTVWIDGSEISENVALQASGADQGIGSSYWGTRSPDNINDGDNSTQGTDMWSGDNCDTLCWAYIDLNIERQISRVRMHDLSGSPVQDFTFQYAPDGVSGLDTDAPWTNLTNVVGNVANDYSYEFSPVTARYVRVRITKGAGTGDQYSYIWELEAYEPRQTNGAGDYNYTIISPSTVGSYTVKVGTSYGALYGYATEDLLVYNLRTIPPGPYLGSTFTIELEIATPPAAYVNFTVRRPDNTLALDNQGGTNSGNFWNSTPVLMNQFGTWHYTVVAQNSTGDVLLNITEEIPMMLVTETLTPTVAPASSNVSVWGHINLSNGTDVINNYISVWLNNTLVGLNDTNYALQASGSDPGVGTTYFFNRQPAYANDGEAAAIEEDMWTGNTCNTLCWVYIDFNQDRWISKIRMYDLASFAVEDFAFQYAPAGATGLGTDDPWTTLVNVTGNPGGNNNYTLEFAPVVARYIRLRITKGPAGYTQYSYIWELEAFGPEDSSATDGSGDYNFTFTVPAIQGTFPVNVSAYYGGDFNSIYGQNSSDLTISGAPPNTTEMVLNATSANNYSSDNLTCYARGEDAENASLTAHWRWYKGGVLNLSGSTNLANDTFSLITTLASGNTSPGETWKCSILMFDGELNETDWNNRSLTIVSACTENGDCGAGYFCNTSSECQAQLSDGGTCVGATLISNATEQAGACLSGYCDNDGVGAADDNWCFTPLTGLYDNQDTKCEESANSSLDDNADEYRNECRDSSGFISDTCVFYSEGDTDQQTCDCIKGAGYWSLGGETSPTTCCEDGGENKRTRLASGTMDAGYASNASDDACCSASNKCVNDSTCYTSGDSSADIDGDGDNDYCSAGTWDDCLTDAECQAGYYCNATRDCVLNILPSTTDMVLNSTYGTNFTNEDLFCWARPIDAESSTLTVYWRWYKDGVLNLSGSKAVNNDSFELITTMSSGSTRKGETWNCSILMYDGMSNETAWNNRSLAIRNTPPVVNLSYPPNNTLADLTLMLNWTFSDADNDTQSAYEIWIDDDPGFSSPEVNVTNSTGLNNHTATLPEGLYYWKVRANDTDAGGSNWSAWTGTWLFAVNIPPAQDPPILNSTFGTNYTTENLTCWNQSTSDPTSPVRNIYAWHLNNTPIMGLNMPFENNGSNTGTTDYSSHGNIATEHNGVVWSSTEGLDGSGAYQFDGTDDYLSVPDHASLDLYDRYSWDFWVKPANAVHQGAIIYRGTFGSPGAYGIRLDSPTWTLQIDIAGSYWVSTVPWDANEWNHFAVTFNGSELRIYKNGTLADSKAAGWVPGDGSIPLYIGARGGNTAFYNGTIDNVRIWNRSLSPEQVYQLYLEGNNTIHTSTLLSQETQEGDNWTCSVTPNDGWQDGPTNTSNWLYIRTAGPTVTLVSPEDNYNSSVSTINFTCSAISGTNLVNMTLYGNWSGGWHANQTNPLSGTSNSTTFTLDIPDGTYVWNCLGYDNVGFDWGDANRTLAIETADYNLTWIKNETTTTVYGYRGGTLANLTYNASTSALELEPGKTKGEYISQVFDAGDVVEWLNISWVNSSTTSPLPSPPPPGSAASLAQPAQAPALPESSQGTGRLLAQPNQTVTLEIPLTAGQVPEFKLHVGHDSEIFQFGAPPLAPGPPTPCSNGICQDSVQDDFDNGTYNQTFYNATEGYVQVNQTFTSGNFTSRVFDAGATSSWDNISWTAVATELELGQPGDNMTGNVLLLHLNNDSTVGENNSRIYDYSQAQNNGTWYGDTAIGGQDANTGWNCTDARLGACALMFDGSEDYILIPDNDSVDFGTGNFALEYWFKTSNTASKIHIWKRDSAVTNLGYYTYLENPGNLTFLAGDFDSVSTYTRCTTSDTYADGQWHHVVAQRAGTGLEIHVDSVNTSLTCPQTGDPGDISNALDLYIGKSTAFDMEFDGLMDEVAIWNRSLSADEIRDHYNSGAFRLTVRSCNDDACSGDAWNETYRGSPQNLSVADNRYFQYEAGLENETAKLYNVTVWYSALNTPPDTTEMVLNSTSGQNYTTDNLTCWARGEDAENTTLAAWWQWWNGSSLFLDGYAPGLANGSLELVSTLGSGNTSKGETWNCSVLFFDGELNETAWNNASLTIGNTAPNQTAPFLNSTNGTNYTNENLTCWNQSTFDADGDPVTNYYTWYRDSTRFDSNLSYTELTTDSNTVLLFHLNNDSSLGENSTLAVDSSGQNNGTLKSSGVLPQWNCTTAKLGACALEFNGNDYIDLDSDITLSGEFTLEFWFNWTPSGGYAMAFGDNSDSSARKIGFAPSGTDKFFLRISDGGSSDQTVDAPTDRLWHHAAVTRNSNNKVDLYLDGTANRLFSDAAQTGDFVIVLIGAHKTNSQFYNGLLDEMAVYNKTLSASEVLEHYRKGKYYTSNTTIPSTLTNASDVWSCNVTPYDGTDYGSSNQSNNLTVLEVPNQPPLHDQPPFLNSTFGTNLTTEDLYCWAFTSDPDGDPVTNYYTWYRDGVEFTEAYTELSPDSSTVLLYHMNNDTLLENSTNVYDYTGNGNNGTFYDNASWICTGAKLGACAVKLDGNWDWIDINDAIISSGNFTYSVWAKPRNVTPFSIVMGQGDSAGNYFRLAILNEGVTFSIDGAVTSHYSDVNLTNNEWYHLALAYDSSSTTGTLYINGTAQSDTSSESADYTATRVRIGANTAAVPAAFFNGTVDEVAIWNRTLSADEILEHYQNSTYGTSTLSSSHTSPGETWYCNVTPWDGEDYGAWNQSNNLTIVDTDPPLTYLLLPPDGSNSTIPETEFVFNSTDTSDISNCSLWLQKDSGAWVLNTTQHYNKELDADPDMALLMHMNNDSSIGENDTHAVDVSGNGNNGTLALDAFWNCTDPKLGACSLDLDGAGDEIQVPDSSSLDITEHIAIEAWIYPRDLDLIPDGDTIVRKTNAYILYFAGAADDEPAGLQLYLYSPGGEINATTERRNCIPMGNFAENAWHHVVATWDGSFVNMYLNGVLKESEPVTGIMSSSANVLGIGASPGGNYYDGLIDELAIYNRSLSASEALEHYVQGMGAFNQSANHSINATLSAGDYNWTIECSDEFGNPANATNGPYNYSVLITILNVTLESPEDGYNSSSSTITFNCSAISDVGLANMTLYGNWTGWHANQTNPLSGTSNSTTFTLDIPDGTYVWNCMGYDTDGLSDWGDANRTLTVDTTDYNLTWLKNETTVTTYGYQGGILTNITYEPFYKYLYLDTGRTNGTYASQIFDTGANVSWLNISWVRGAGTGSELELGQLSTDNMTANMLLLHLNNDSSVGEGGPYEYSSDANMALWMHLNNDSSVGENDTLAYDYSGSGNNGTLAGAAWNCTERKLGDCSLELGGNNDHASVDGLVTDLAGDTAGTVEFWANLDADNGNQNFIFSVSRDADSTRTEFFIDFDMRDPGDRIHSALKIDGTIQWELTTPVNSLDPHVGQWVHVAVVQNGTSPKLYFNGAEQILSFAVSTDKTKWFKAILTDAASPADTANIGMIEVNGADYDFNGTVDEVAVYDRVLTAAEIAQHAGVYVHDHSPEGNNGTLVDAAWSCADPRFGDCAAGFDGDSDYINFSGLPDIIPPQAPKWTVEAWVKANEWSGDNYGSGILHEETSAPAFWSKFYLRVNNSGYLEAAYRDAPSNGLIVLGQSNSSVPTGSWHHIAVVMDTDSNESRFYIDGVLDAVNSSWFGGPITNSSPGELKVIGAGQVGNALNEGFFNGTIDEVAVWNRSLSADEVLDHYERSALSLTVRSCNDSVCLGDAWNETYRSSPQNLSVADNQYFQYRAGFEGGAQLHNVTVWYTRANTPPNTTLLVLNSTSGNNLTTDDLHCWARGEDAENATLGAYWQWWNGSSLFLDGYTPGLANGSLHEVATLGSGNTSIGETWNCSVLLFDGELNESAWNNASITIAGVTCGTITQNTTLTNDLQSNGTCFTIGADNITLDCAGHTITGNGIGNGIYLSGRTNVMIENCTIINFTTGIYLTTSSNNTLISNTLDNNVNYGAYLVSSSNNNTLTSNTVISSGWGITASTSSYNIITNNTVTSNPNGIYIKSSSINNTLTSNTVTGSTEEGIRLEPNCNNNILTSNIVNNSKIGIYVRSSSNTLTNNTAKNNTNYGISLESASSNTLSNNTMTGNTNYDLYIISGSGNTLLDQLTKTYKYLFSNTATLTLHDTNEAKLQFLQSITESGSNLSANIALGNNTVFVNSNTQPGFNVSANLTLYNITFTNPLPTWDPEDDGSFVVCPTSICTEIDYTAGAFKYNVTQFTTYSSEETPPNLTMQIWVMTCDDPDCIGESWTGPYASLPQDLTVPDNQYFRYKVELETDSPAHTPRLHNVTVWHRAPIPIINITAPQGIYEPLCCAGGKTGEQCITDGDYNPATGIGDVYCTASAERGSSAGDPITINDNTATGYKRHIQHTFYINLTNVSAVTSDTVSCLIEQSNNTLFNVSMTGLSLSGESLVLNYTLKSSDSILRDKSSAPTIHDTPWYLYNCSVRNSTGYEKLTFNISRRIHVHQNMKWEVFDFQNAVQCESFGNKFFNNTAKCELYTIGLENKSYERDLAFDRYAGTPTEAFCHSGVDNDGDGQADQADPNCMTFTDSYRSLTYYGAYNETTRAPRRAPMRASIPDADNLISGTVGGTSYQYTANTDSSGAWKIRFYESDVGTDGYIYTIEDMPYAASVSMIGDAPGHPAGSYLNQPLPACATCNLGYECMADACKAGGPADIVLIVNFTDTSQDKTATINLKVTHGTTVASQLVTIYLDPTDGLTNQDESETSAATSSNMCNDSANNDLDISTGYTYINNLGPFNRIGFSRDCLDLDCEGITGPALRGVTNTCLYRNESRNYPVSCQDSYDNDWNDNYLADAYGLTNPAYNYTDCHDLDCFQMGGLNTDIVTNPCPLYENNSAAWCYDGINNDWDYTDTDAHQAHKIENSGQKYTEGAYTSHLTDCEDIDCDGFVGNITSGAICEWGHELNCSDGFNNDALQQLDCVIGGATVGTTADPSFINAEYDCSAYCRATVTPNETGTQCDDGLDNDWDFWYATADYYTGTENTTDGAGIDCRWIAFNPDEDCNMTWLSSGYQCQLGIELNCTDNFDNDFDADSGNPQSGWAYNNDGYRTYNNGADCADYDCYMVQDPAGNWIEGALHYACPTNEYTGVAGGTPNASWCFDGIDNDLDNLTDCNDPDCAMVTNPLDPNESCLLEEFNLTRLETTGSSPNYCGDLLDNDERLADNQALLLFTYNSLGWSYIDSGGSQYPDCRDEDCYRVFGNCAPCSSNEFVKWDACFDGFDNDHGSDGTDTGDPDCSGKLIDREGHLEGQPITEACTNFWDDDNDAKADCADPDCTGQAFSPDGRVCGTLGAENCTDDFNNDGASGMDCYDSACNTPCGYPGDVSGTGTIDKSPRNSSYTLTGDFTVTAYITRYVRIGSDLYVRYQYTGSDTNPPVVVLGDTTDPNLKIPLSAFDPPNAVLTVSDGFTLDKTFANEGQLRFTRATGGSYDFTVMIPGKGVFLNDTTIRSVASFGTKLSEGILHTEVVDADAPTASTLTIEPSGGKLTHGDSIWARAYATDPDTGQQTWEGYVAFCEVRITGPGGFDYASNASNCKYSRPVYSSGTYTVYVTPYDRTGNAGATISSSQPISVAPKITQHISDLSMVWHKNQAGFDAIESGVTAKFQTSTNESYSFPTCIATYFNGTDGSFIQTSTIATTPDTDGSGSVTCRITGKLPAPIAQNDGVYWVTINATDSQGYTLQTIPHIFYVCNSLASSGTGWDCAYADFDQDGYTEGVLQPFNYSGTYYVCDNCPDIYNPDQKDANGNGVGDACEVLNYPPDTIEMVLNSTHGTDYPDEDLFCYARGTDVESPNLTAYWRWHKDGVLNLSGSTNVTNDTFELITTLGSGNTSAGETWSCSILMFDGELNETAWNTRSLTILAPPIVGTIGIRLTLPDNTHTVYVPGMGELSPTSDGGWDSAPHWFIASHKDNNLYALVHNYQTPVSLGLTHTGQNHTIILVQNLTNSHAFVVFSEGDQAAIENRMPLIEGHEFLKKISPSFAYGLGLLHPIKVLLESAIDLQNDLILHEGFHEVLFEYNQSPAGDPAVAFSRTG